MEMSILIVALILFGFIFFFLGTGLWIAVALGVVGFIGLTVFLEGMDVIIAAATFNVLCSYPMAAMPLFIFMGEIIYQSGLNKKLYRGASKWVGVLPGSLLHANIVSCAIFAACSGSSMATAATMGSVAYPEQKERGYDNRMVLGSLAGGGTLGILIPPSITMIIYGAFVGESVGRLFMGGVVPGFATALMFMVYIGVRSVANPGLVPERRQRVTLRYFPDAVIALKDVWPALVLIFFIMGSIYGGLATPTEAGAVAALIALVLAALFKSLNFGVLKRAALETISLNAMIAFILLGASILGYAFSLLKIPFMLAGAVAAAGLSPLTVWLLALLLYLFLGCFIPGLAVMILTLPVIYPLLTGLGFDGVWLGVMLVMTVECAMLTPPVGTILFVLQRVAKEKDITNVALGSLPFFGVLVVSVAIWTFFPQLVLFLPNMMFAPRW